VLVLCWAQNFQCIIIHVDTVEQIRVLWFRQNVVFENPLWCVSGCTGVWYIKLASTHVCNVLQWDQAIPLHWVTIIVAADKKATKTVKISRLAVLPMEVQLTYWSSQFLWPAIIHRSGLWTFHMFPAIFPSLLYNYACETTSIKILPYFPWAYQLSPLQSFHWLGIAHFLIKSSNYVIKLFWLCSVWFALEGRITLQFSGKSYWILVEIWKLSVPHSLV